MNKQHIARSLPTGPVFLALVCLLLWFATAAHAASVIKATPDLNPVRMDDTFELVFSSEDSVDDDPDFSPLREDFEVFGQNQSSEFSIVNGHSNRTRRWTVTLSPKRAGNLTIPSIAFGGDHSPPVNLTVLEANAAAGGADADDAELKLEVDAKPKNPYVQAQVIMTVRVLLRVSVAGADLSEPALPDTLVERLGEDHRYSTLRNGREYTVIERQYALFPQKSGLLRIDPLQLTAQVETGGRSFFSRATRAVRIKSNALDLKVRPQPAEFTGSHWLPAADLKLEESWPQNAPQAKAGEPITRTLTLRAEQATVSLLPELSTNLHLDSSIKQYPDQPALNEEKQPNTGFVATRQEKIALIPGKAGEYKFPAVEVPWWNTKTERMEIARIPERILKVEASGEAPPQAATSEAASQTGSAPLAVPAIQETTLTPTAATTNLWFWLALLFGSGWLATALAWWLSRRKAPEPSSSAPPPTKAPVLDTKQTRKALQQACEQHDPAAARAALLAWAQALWPAQRPDNLQDIAKLGDAALAAEIERLNRALYGADRNAWHGQGLWKAATAEEAMTNKPETSKASGLEPLYR
jgi:hypothetical protein